jgi:hypothetical protein
MPKLPAAMYYSLKCQDDHILPDGHDLSSHGFRRVFCISAPQICISSLCAGANRAGFVRIFIIGCGAAAFPDPMEMP